MPLFDPYSVPGFKEAVERETTVRDNVFANAPEILTGFTVRPLSMRTFLILDGMGSPFVKAKERFPLPHDVAMFLWVISTRFSRTDSIERDRFIKECRVFNKVDAHMEACVAINQYLEDAFQDAPGGSNTGRSAVASMSAVIIHLIASRYHWTEDEIMDKALKKIFQFIRLIQVEKDPNTIMFNPSDRVIRQHNLADKAKDVQKEPEVPGG